MRPVSQAFKLSPTQTRHCFRVLQQDAGLLGDGGLRVEVRPHRLGEHFLYAFLVEGRALHVADGLDLAGEGGALLVGDRRLVLLLELPLNLGIVPEVTFRADQEDGNAGTVVGHLVTRAKVIIISGKSF